MMYHLPYSYSSLRPFIFRTINFRTLEKLNYAPQHTKNRAPLIFAQFTISLKRD